MKTIKLLVIGVAFAAVLHAVQAAPTYPVVGTGQTKCFDNLREIAPPQPGQPFYGQNAQYRGIQPACKDNGDGTVSDLNTGLMWVQKPPTDKYTWADAAQVAASLNAQNFAGHGDWRLPSAKELYSIINHDKGWPYIDTRYFVCELAPEIEDQVKNTQYWTSNESVAVAGRPEAFGVNFATGHIKAYPVGMGSYVRCVRGNPDYGKNDLVANNDKTITDRATGLMWSQEDSQKGLNWEEALAWVQARNGEDYLGHNDWRLPNVREMQSIVDYARIPGAAHSTGVATAIDPLFLCTPITDQDGNTDCPYYWTSTSCYNGPTNPDYRFAWYVSFGRPASSTDSGGPGVSRARSRLVAEAGAIRYDAKVKSGAGGGPGGPGSRPAGPPGSGPGAGPGGPGGGPSGRPGGGPGGGGERICNYVRLVRGGNINFISPERR